MTVSSNETKQAMLAERYRTAGDGHVAFVDESYLAPNAEHAGTGTFYLLTAFVVPTSLHAPIRGDLTSIVGSEFWHTTAAQRDPKLRPVIDKLCSYIAEGSEEERILVAVRAPIALGDQNAEDARARAFVALLAALIDLDPPVKLVVYEERRFQAQRAADVATIKRARGLSTELRVLPVFAASPAYESLLWLPDVISFALYQRHGRTRWSDYAAPFASRVRYVSGR